MKAKLLVIIGIIIMAIYLPIHYYYPFLGIGVTTTTYVFCEDGFVPSGDKCVPDPKIIKDISVGALADNLCQNHTLGQNETGTFLTCMHTNNDSKETVFDLPPPVYMLKLCTSMHGCMYPYTWVPQIQPNLISEEQKQQAIGEALALPQTKNWPSKPQLNQFLIIASSDKWIANIEFFIEGVKMPQHNKCEYYDSVELDLETLEIRSGFRDFDDFEKCKNQ